MERDDVLKLNAAALYVVKKCGKAGYIRLFKILYFASREHIARYGRPIIADNFYALPKGPIPTFLYDALKHSHKSEEEKLATEGLYNPVEEEYYVLKTSKEPDMDELSESEVECLDNAISKYKDMPENELSARSHGPAWKEHCQSHGRMNELSIAKEGGANEAMLDYIKENMLVDDLIS